MSEPNQPTSPKSRPPANSNDPGKPAGPARGDRKSRSSQSQIQNKNQNQDQGQGQGQDAAHGVLSEANSDNDHSKSDMVPAPRSGLQQNQSGGGGDSVQKKDSSSNSSDDKRQSVDIKIHLDLHAKVKLELEADIYGDVVIGLL